MSLSSAVAQNIYPVRAAFADVPPVASVLRGNNMPPPLLEPITYPRMAPELAFQVYVNRSVTQTDSLAGYTALTTIDATLPDSKQYGEFELNRTYTAPHALKFHAVRFTGDNFVKVNVIGRWLQSEVDRQQRGQSGDVTVNRINYKVAYKKTTLVSGRVVHQFQLKPRAKRPGLFKGQIWVDAYTGSLVRAEGRMVSSPSIFIKNIDFRQDYADSGAFSFPTRLHTEARVRLLGRVVVDISNRDYRPYAAGGGISAAMATATPAN
jgi:hypothetical protein